MAVWKRRFRIFVTRYRSDVQVRVNASLRIGFLSSVIYAAFQAGLGIYHASVWFYTMAAYYILLAIMRFFLLRHTRMYRPGRNRIREWKSYRFCGICLLFMNMALAVIIFYITWQNRTFHHHPITTIAMATYTFSTFTVAVVNLIRYRKYKSPVYSAAKIISLIAACVSMLTLETAMLTAFDESNDMVFRQMTTGLTGAAVAVFVLGVAVYMIRTSNRCLRKIALSEES